VTTNPYSDGTIRTPEQIEKSYREAHDPKRAATSEQNIIAGAWLTAFLVPIVGFVLGAILTTRQRELHGIWTMIASTVMAYIWLLVIIRI
jgi:hypothetical protein